MWSDENDKSSQPPNIPGLKWCFKISHGIFVSTKLFRTKENWYFHYLVCRRHVKAGLQTQPHIGHPPSFQVSFKIKNLNKAFLHNSVENWFPKCDGTPASLLSFLESVESKVLNIIGISQAIRLKHKIFFSVISQTGQWPFCFFTTFLILQLVLLSQPADHLQLFQDVHIFQGTPSRLKSQSPSLLHTSTLSFLPLGTSAEGVMSLPPSVRPSVCLSVRPLLACLRDNSSSI